MILYVAFRFTFSHSLSLQAVHEDKVQNLERAVEKLEDKMDKMMDSDEDIMKQHELLFKKLEQDSTGYSYN